MRRVVGSGGESGGVVRVSESSPGSSFRELDDVFLQTQARIWLGEVLHLRFDEETSMADLIADGELLFEVSKVVWKMLVKQYSDLKHSKLHIYERTSSGKNDGRYLRYPKVDSFLKVCQILGLTSIDLFTPSDVVEKRDTRKVCMCIRSLSIKARTKYLNVPDFDIVTYTIAMPNYVVGGICRNLLEKSKSSSSNSSFGSRGSYRQRYFGGNFDQSQEELHYDSDEAESCLTEMEYESPILNASFDIIPSDLHEEIGENCSEISEKQRDSVSNSNPISEIKMRHIDELASTSSCESSVGDSWQGQDGHFTPESKLISKFELEKSEGNFTEELSSNVVRKFDVPNVKVPDLNSDCVVPDLNSGDLTVQIAEKIGYSEFSSSQILISEAKFEGLNKERLNEEKDKVIMEEFGRISTVGSLKFESEKSEDNFSEELSSNLDRNYDDPKFESTIQDCKATGTGIELPDLNSESEVLDLNSGDLTCQNVEKIGYSEFTSIQNLTSEAKFSTSTEIKAEDELGTEKVTEECQNKDIVSEENSRNKIQNQDLGQKVLTSVAGGVTLVGIFIIFLQLRKRSKERNGAIGLLSRVNKTKEESSERNIEIQKPKAVYPAQWLKI